MALRSTPKRFPRLSIDALEPRENPAGLITNTLSAAGVLSVTGADESSNITLNFAYVPATGISTVTFTANNGETFSTAGPLIGTVKSVAIKMAGGDDRIAATGTLNVGTAAAPTGALAIDLGDGDNEFDASGLTALASGPVTYTGGDGSDRLNIHTSAASTITGAVTVKGTLGNLDVFLATTAATALPVTGGVSVTNNGGNTDVELTKVTAPKVTVSGGDGSTSDDESFLLLTNTVLTGPLTMTSGYNDTFATVSGGQIKGATVTSKGFAEIDTTNINFGATATPTGDVVVYGGGGAYVSIDQTGVADSAVGNVTATSPFSSEIVVSGGVIGGTNSKTVGNLTAKGGTGGDGRITVTAATAVGAVNATAAAGGDDAIVQLNTVTKVGTVTATTVGADDASVTLTGVKQTGAVTVSAGDTGSVSMNSSVTGVAATHVGGNVTVSGATGSVGVSGVGNEVNGNVAVTGKRFGGVLTLRNANSTLTVQGTTAVTGALGATLDLQAGTGAAEFVGNVAVTETSPLRGVTVNVLGDKATFDKNLTVKTAGYSTTKFAATSATEVSEVKGDYTFTGGQYEDSFNFNTKFKAKNVKIDAKNGDLTLDMGATNGAQVAVTGALTVTAGYGDDTVNLKGVAVTGLTTVSTGAGQDAVSIDNSTFTGATKIDTGAGDDTLTIGVAGSPTNATSFVGLATVTLGAGNDGLTLGDSTGDPVKNKVSFTNAASKFDGGLGFDDIAANTSTTLNLMTQFLNFES